MQVHDQLKNNNNNNNTAEPTTPNWPMTSSEVYTCTPASPRDRSQACTHGGVAGLVSRRMRCFGGAVAS